MAASVTPRHQHARQQSGASSHGPVPGSPTLTNPDMILPDYEFPDSPQRRSPSPIRLWTDPNIDQMDFQLPQSQYGSQFAPTATPIIYGNGTMLSDIGEVTEVESTVGPASRRASSRYSAYTENETFGTVAAISNKAYQRRSKMLGRERRSSIESTSTITTQDNRATFADFDDSVSVDDSSFQGDDEESMASSYVEGTAPRHPRIEASKPEAGGGDYSTLYISNRAEQILANAKRRLTAMEGNLSRARSSLGYSEGGSTPSPQLGLPGSAVRDGTASQTPGHWRIKSEDGTRDISKQPNLVPQRSASALGAAGGYRQPTSRFKHDETGAPASHPAHGISHHALDTTLESVSEDDDHDNDPTSDSMRDSAHLSSFLSPTSGSHSDNGLPARSASVAQMRDIQDQMQGLRGKISTLKEQAKADSLKRRSLQSLRTPSPFTHARWDQGLREPRTIQSMDSREPTPTKLWINGEENQDGHAGQESGAVDNQDHSSGQAEQKSSDSEPHRSSGSPEGRATPTRDFVADNNLEGAADGNVEDFEPESRDDSDQGDYETEYDDAQDVLDWESESGESLYHDTQQHQMSHEDREDAFDYEHFFLHSAMGSIRRHDQSGSSESELSDTSVETTRGPMSSLSRKRRSIETTASDDTFATATEGRASRSSAFRGEMGGFYDGGYDELPPLQEVRSHDDAEGANSTQEPRQRQNSVLYRPTSAAKSDRIHSPSASSFESTGTNRSFPLVNKAKLNGGVLTPGGSPDPGLRQISDILMNDTASALGMDDATSQGQSAVSLQDLHRDDQIAVERLVASLGKCVLGLGEASRASTESRLFRRRIDAARRILEGQDES
ncbi:hypothetical protein ACO1O0_001198 [Amphichorda felina]